MGIEPPSRANTGSYPNADFTGFYTEFFPGATRNFLAGLTYGF